MSLLNGISGLGAGIGAFASSGLKDTTEKVVRMPLLGPSGAPPDQAASPAIAASAESTPAPNTAGPRMPPGANPYGSNPHAAALWLAERSIMGPESAGKIDAQNLVSSAGGLFQVINPTWDAQMQKMGLPVASSDAERNVQKYQPDLNIRVMRAINTQAAGALDAAGLPVNIQTLQAAHRLGPGGAAEANKAAIAKPEAPL